MLPFFLRMCLENENTRDKIKFIDLSEDDTELAKYIKENLKKEKNGKSTQKNKRLQRINSRRD